MVKLNPVNKDVLKQERVIKKMERRKRAKANWRRFTGKLMNIYYKARDTVKDKIIPTVRNTIIPWVSQNVTRENINKVKDTLRNISGAITDGANFVSAAGGIIGGKFGNTLQRGANKFEQKHQEINQRGTEIYEQASHKAGEAMVRAGQLVNAGRDAYGRIRGRFNR